VKKETHEVEEKLTALTAQRVEEIVEIEKEIIKEVVTVKESSQKFIQKGRSV
jgi:hypothetical protein